MKYDSLEELSDYDLIRECWDIFYLDGYLWRKLRDAKDKNDKQAIDNLEQEHSNVHKKARELEEECKKRELDIDEELALIHQQYPTPIQL